MVVLNVLRLLIDFIVEMLIICRFFLFWLLERGFVGIVCRYMILVFWVLLCVLLRMNLVLELFSWFNLLSVDLFIWLVVIYVLLWICFIWIVLLGFCLWVKEFMWYLVLKVLVLVMWWDVGDNCGLSCLIVVVFILVVCFCEVK